MRGVKLPARLLPFYRLPADIPAAESIRPFDAIDRLISAPLRFGDGLACRADVQHAAAIGENGSALRNRTRVDDFDALDRGRVIEPLYPGALPITSAIALRLHHHP